jgi:excisionase family DNA binding protein
MNDMSNAGAENLAFDAGEEQRDEILTAREAQEYLKIGRTKLWDLTRRNEIPAYRVGPGSRSSLRYKRAELLRWLEGNRVNGTSL